MDCDQFESIETGDRDDELDPLTRDAARAHVRQCARCAALIAGAPARTAPAIVTRMSGAVSVAGSWAMRPQTAMAAVFLVMLGTSGLLLRSKSSRAPASAEMTVTEEGTPAPAALSAFPADPSDDRSTAPAPSSTVSSSPFVTAMAAYGLGQFDDAARAFGTIAPGNPDAELWQARALREGQGCAAAVAHFDGVARRAAGSRPGWEAAFEGASCYFNLGDVGGARARLTSLLDVDGFGDRARAELVRFARAKPAQAQQ